MYKKVYITTKRVGNLHIISDHHFDHEAILKHCKRPFATLEEMNETMVERHNKQVAKHDTVILNGDLAYKNHSKWIQALNGKKTMVIGNHDKMSQKVLSQFTHVVGSHKEPAGMTRVIDGHYCTISHFPMWSWNGSFHGSWHFYGHCHGRKREVEHRQPDIAAMDGIDVPPRLEEFAETLSCAVDVDVWDYTPIPWEVLKQKMLSRVDAWKERKSRWVYAETDEGEDANSKRKPYPEILANNNRDWRESVVFRSE